MAFLALVLVLVVLVKLATVNSRLRELTGRLELLERTSVPYSSPGFAPVVQTSEAERDTTRVPVGVEPDVEPRAEPEPPVQQPIVEAEPVNEPARAPQIPDVRPTTGERVRRWLANTELEALVGGSVLNKLGATVLVMGIALFLGYSFTRMQPGGRALLSICVSVALLGAGVITERREKYRVFARGLIGAGWAALYATSYAIWAIPAARLIENPVTGSTLMVFTAAVMVGHSLRYRSQALTSIAYFAAFAALGVTPSTPFATAALIPLSASVLYLARRFDWYPMAWFGMVATYGTCISRGASNAPLASTMTLLVAYFVLFESFDLFRVSRRISGGWIETLFPLNAAGFLGLTFLAWHTKALDQMWLAAALTSALAR